MLKRRESVNFMKWFEDVVRVVVTKKGRDLNVVGETRYA